MKIKKINLLGDSITWGYAPITGEKLRSNYGDILKERLKLEVLNNYGINSSTLASGENAFEPMCLRYKQMDDDADLVIVFGGTNDYGRDDFSVKLGSIDDEDTSTVYGALKQICTGLKEKYKHSILLFLTPLQRGFLENDCNLKYATKLKNNLGYTLEDVSNAIKKVCGMYDIDVFDLYQECGINTKKETLKYLPDGLHPTEEYHRILGEKIVNFIKEKYEKRVLNMPEIWDILNENGNKTGKVMHKGENVPEGFYHGGSDVWIINSENKILIQKRSPMKKLSPNVWAMTGGSIIKGETSLQTIEREVLEELGIQLNLQDLQLIKTYKTGEVWLDEFLIKQDIDLCDIAMQKDEVSDVKWATYDEIEELFENGQFLKNRWEFVRELIKERLEK